MTTEQKKPVALIIRDGWGVNPYPEQDAYNAVKLANTPFADAIAERYPVALLEASGLAVGLPEGVMGNSEVGHQNIGAGRIVDQEVVRISKGFREGTIAGNPVWRNMLDSVRASGGNLHLMGIVSDAGVHGLIEHLEGLLLMLKKEGFPADRVKIHAFMDGRDTGPFTGKEFLAGVRDFCQREGVGQIASVCGRFWSMDRDNRWDRVQQAYSLLTGGAAAREDRDPVAAVQHYYDHPLDDSRKGDEFVLPTRIVDANGAPVGVIQSGDAVLFYNYRGDRPRELTRAFVEENFDGFERPHKISPLVFCTMTEYQKGLPVDVLFLKPEKMVNILGDYVSKQGIPQFRCAETEKYPHVTFFFNDYREEPFAGEDRKVAPSPKVTTYDLKPEMSAEEVCDAAIAAVESGKYGLLVINFANPDMVGHTGSLEATIKAVETVDRCVERLVKAVLNKGGKALVVADHGNCEQMYDPVTQSPHTAHTLNLVQCIPVGEGCEQWRLRERGKLADIAPTILKMMGLTQPAEMTGDNLIL
jgi:2,3-bisphosphoglycerate-independent phosphoglycerate mutase